MEHKGQIENLFTYAMRLIAIGVVVSAGLFVSASVNKVHAGVGEVGGRVYMIVDGIEYALPGVELNLQPYWLHHKVGASSDFCLNFSGTKQEYFAPVFDQIPGDPDDGVASCWFASAGRLALTDSNGNYFYGNDSNVVCDNDGEDWVPRGYPGEVPYSLTPGGEFPASSSSCGGWAGLSCGEQAHRWFPYFPSGYDLGAAIGNPAIVSSINFNSNDLFGGGEFHRNPPGEQGLEDGGAVVVSQASCEAHASDLMDDVLCPSIPNPWIVRPPGWTGRTEDYVLQNYSYFTAVGVSNKSEGDDLDFEWVPDINEQAQCQGLTSTTAQGGNIQVSSDGESFDITVSGSDGDGAPTQLRICYATGGQTNEYYAGTTGVGTIFNCDTTTTGNGTYTINRTLSSFTDGGTDDVPNPLGLDINSVGIHFVGVVFDSPLNQNRCNANSVPFGKPVTEGLYITESCEGNLTSCTSCTLGANNCRLNLTLAEVQESAECAALTVNGESSFTVTQGDSYDLNLSTSVTPPGISVSSGDYQYNSTVGSVSSSGGTATWSLSADDTNNLPVGTTEDAATVTIAGGSVDCSVDLVVQEVTETPMCSFLTADGESTVQVQQGQDYTFDLETGITPQGISVSDASFQYTANIGSVSGSGATPQWTISSNDLSALTPGVVEDAVSVTLNESTEIICALDLELLEGAPSCGDNMCDPDETCEFDGGGGEYSCPSGDPLPTGSCRTTSCDYCGDGTVDTGEVCEPGMVNPDTGQSCNSSCQWGDTPQCGSTCETNAQCPDEMDCSGSPGSPGTCVNPSCPGEPDCTCQPGAPLCNDVCTDDTQCPSTMECIGGYCRNPVCSAETDCSCTELPPTGVIDSRGVTVAVLGILLMISGFAVFRIREDLVFNHRGTYRRTAALFLGVISKDEYKRKRFEEFV